MKRGQARYFLFLVIFVAVVVIFISINNSNSNKLTGHVIGDVCTETDNGVDYNSSGTLTHNGLNFSDFCQDQIILTEFYCNITNDTISSNYSCSIGCLNGKCNSQNICSDSDNGNYSIQGTTTGRNQSNPNQNISGTDYCINSSLLNEYSCGETYNDYLVNETHACTTGCADGTCNSSLSCVSSWKPVNTTCESNDRLTTWFNDSSSCETNSGKPPNETHHCDDDGNGLIGNFSTDSYSGFIPVVYVDGVLLNTSNVFSGTKKIKVNDGDSMLLEFQWDFSTPFDLDNVYIEKQPNSSKQGYLLIRNIDANKTVRVDKKNSSTNSVCVKNSDVSSQNSMTSSCSSTNEKLVPCPGSNSSYTCSLDGNIYTVSGITNSLIKEFTGGVIGSNCISNWACLDWSNCINNQQMRVCTDSSSCPGAISPLTTRSCTENRNANCIENWDCEFISECVNGKRNQTCIDQNNCGTIASRPPNSIACKKPGSFVWLFWTIVIILIIIILIVVALIIHFWMQNELLTDNRIKINQVKKNIAQRISRY